MAETHQKEARMDNLYRRLITFSYNILGPYEDAKDLVHDTLEKYISLDKSHVQNEANFLIKSVINLSINFKKQNSKVSKFGVWLPEPINTESPDTKIIKEQTANYSLLVLMEKLNPKERAVFILKEGFDYAHDKVASVLGISPENSRQLFSRAKRALGNVTFNTTPAKPDTLKVYVDAIVAGEVKHLERLLMDDIRIFADGGSKIKVIKDLILGKTTAMKVLLFVYNNFQHRFRYSLITVNHHPAICFYKHDTLMYCQVFRFSGGKISDVYAIVDSNKLKNLSC
jgi:RNA polymerase sigma-70 factor (ECF subfamily)